MINLTLVYASMLILFVLDLIMVAIRSAFVHTSYVRLLQMREEQEQRVNQTLPVVQSLQRVRASLSLVLVLVRFLLAGLVLYLAITLLDAHPLINTAILLLAALLLFWFEWIVEIFIMRDAEDWSMRFTPFARVLTGLLSLPLALPMAFTGEKGVEAEQTGGVTEDEVRTLVDASQEEGNVEEDERRMIHSIFDLDRTLVREIMIPRVDMVVLDVNTPLPDAVDMFVGSGYSRVPVYEDAVDNTLGLLYAKDLLRVYREGAESDSLHDLLRAARFVPEAKRVDELMEEMQDDRVHIAIVVDEYGGVAGLVTLEDIVEEIFGEIQDEYDQAAELPYQKLKDGDYLFTGLVDVDDFNVIMDSNLPREEADTLGGFIYSRLGRVPDVGEQVTCAGLQLTVEQVSARRIRKVRASRLPPQAEDEDNDRNGHR